MELVIGGLFQGKTKYINKKYNLNLTESKYFSKYVDDNMVVLLNCHLFESDLMKYIKGLSNDKTIICSTVIVGSSIVPISKEERLFRDRVGVINKQLVEKSKITYKIWNGLVERVK